MLDEADRQYQTQLEAERIKSQAAEQAAEQARAEAARRSAQPTTPTGDFDKEEFAKQFLDDPRKSLHYAIKHDPVLGGVFQQLAAGQAALAKQLEDINYERQAEAFVKASSDYVPNEENFKVMESVMAEKSLPWNSAGLGLAWAYAKEQGLVELGEQQVAEPSFAPPSIRSRRSSQIEPDDVMAQFESLSPDKQKAYLESLTAR